MEHRPQAGVGFLVLTPSIFFPSLCDGCHEMNHSSQPRVPITIRLNLLTLWSRANVCSPTFWSILLWRSKSSTPRVGFWWASGVIFIHLSVHNFSLYRFQFKDTQFNTHSDSLSLSYRTTAPQSRPERSCVATTCSLQRTSQPLALYPRASCI